MESFVVKCWNKINQVIVEIQKREWLQQGKSVLEMICYLGSLSQSSAKFSSFVTCSRTACTKWLILYDAEMLRNLSTKEKNVLQEMTITFDELADGTFKLYHRHITYLRERIFRLPFYYAEYKQNFEKPYLTRANGMSALRNVSMKDCRISIFVIKYTELNGVEKNSIKQYNLTLVGEEEYILTKRKDINIKFLYLL